jgi:hypothetical protein
VTRILTFVGSGTAPYARLKESTGAQGPVNLTWSYVDNLMRPESSWSSFNNRGEDFVETHMLLRSAPTRGMYLLARVRPLVSREIELIETLNR